MDNSISLHTSEGCLVEGNGQTGVFETSDCWEQDNNNSGCGTLANDTTVPHNYGKSLNDIDGGVYVTEWTSDFIKTWFFPRGAIPASITAQAPDVTEFGTPIANQQGPNCIFDEYFNNHSVIINTDFCGAWAGFGYPAECPQSRVNDAYNSCVDFVGDNPSNFTDAYWQINSLRVYQMPAGASASDVSTVSTSYSSTVTPQSTAGNTLDHGMGASTSTNLSSIYTGPLSSSLVSESTTAYTLGDVDSTTLSQYSTVSTSSTAASVTSTSSLAAYTTTTSSSVSSTSSSISSNTASSSSSSIFYDYPTLSAYSNTITYSEASTTSGSPSSTSTVPMSQVTETCPGINNTIMGDENNVYYTIHCSADTTVGSFQTQYADGPFSVCFDICDATSGCVGFTYVPNVACYLKNAYGPIVSASSGYVAAMMVQTTSTSSSSMMASTSSSSAGGYSPIGTTTLGKS